MPVLRVAGQPVVIVEDVVSDLGGVVEARRVLVALRMVGEEPRQDERERAFAAPGASFTVFVAVAMLRFSVTG